MKNKAVITVISLIAVFGFLTLVYYLINGSSGEKINQETSVVNNNDHVKWASNKKNLFIEYSDFQCPACKVFHNELKKLEKDKNITESITFIYRHFPLTQHINAKPSAYAAEAAGKQNKFYEMSDLIFDAQDQWESLQDPKDFFSDLAKKLNLDINKFKKDYESKDIKQKVESDFISGERTGINATPTFFLNGKKLNINSIDEFKNILTTPSKK